jgi:hypothetical protein
MSLHTRSAPHSYSAGISTWRQDCPRSWKYWKINREKLRNESISWSTKCYDLWSESYEWLYGVPCLRWETGKVIKLRDLTMGSLVDGYRCFGGTAVSIFRVDLTSISPIDWYQRCGRTCCCDSCISKGGGSRFLWTLVSIFQITRNHNHKTVFLIDDL